MADLTTSPVNIGLSPNDGTGDSIRRAFDITNKNVANITSFLEMNPEFSNITVVGTIATDNISSATGSFSNQLMLTGNIASSNTTSGSLVVIGGAGVSGKLNVGGSINGDSLTVNSLIGGSLLVTGGAGITGNLQVGNIATHNILAEGITTNSDVVINGDLTVHGNVTTVTTSEFVIRDPIIEIGGGETAAGDPAILTSDDGLMRGIQFYYFNTPALEQRTGFMGFDPEADQFNFYSNIEEMTLGNAIFGNINANVTSIGTSHFANTTIDSLSVTSGITGTLLTPAQPNITSVGTLSSLVTTGNITVSNGNIAVINGDINLPAGHNIYVDGVAVALSSQAFVGGVVPNSTLFTSGEQSTSTTTGAVRITGGLGVTGNVNISNSLTTSSFNANTLGGTLTTADQPNITSVGTLGNLNVAGQLVSNSSIVNNLVANNAVDASVITASVGLGGKLTTPAQPNITSVGTLSSLDVSGNINITGTNINGEFTDVSLNIVTANGFIGNVVGSAVTVTAPAQPAITSVGTLTSLNVTGNTTVGNLNAGAGVIKTDGNIVTTTNVIGSSLYGRLMTNNQPNVTSIGSLTSLTVTGTTVLQGPTSISGMLNVANSVVVSGDLTAGSLTTAGTITAGAFVGEMTGVATSIVGQANSATITATSTATAGNVVLRDASGNFSSNSITATTFIGTLLGDVITPSQTNITSVGTLTSLNVAGNVTASSYTGSGAGLTSIPNSALVGGGDVTIGSTVIALGGTSTTLSGLTSVSSSAFSGPLTGNVTGNVSGSAATAGTVTAAAQPAITSVGTLTSLAVTGGVTAGSFNGSGSGLTSIPWSGVVKPTRTNWATIDADNTVVGQLSWRNYSNGHTIFDASAGTSPDGTAVDNTNPGTYWVATYPTLMGWNGATTYGVRVDSARTSDTVQGLGPTSSNVGNSVVTRDASGNFSAGVITAVATNARYADLAEMYQSDAQYDSGTVLVFGGTYEVTTTGHQADVSVAGVVSTAPAYLMNIDAKHAVAVALRGKVPVKVTGPVRKGDLLVTSYVPGFAMSIGTSTEISAVAVFAKSLEEDLTDGQKLINAVII